MGAPVTMEFANVPKIVVEKVVKFCATMEVPVIMAFADAQIIIQEHIVKPTKVICNISSF